MSASRRRFAILCTHGLVGVIAVIACVRAFGCGRQGGSATHGPWQRASVAYDASCTGGCEDLGELALGEVGDYQAKINRAVDDDVAQWGDCLQSVLSCIDAGGGVSSCVAASACPENCRTSYARQTLGQTDEDALLDAFEILFIEAGGECVPDQEEIAP